ncbi:Mitogen-activated protein kinase [Mycena kentingensis (nom. inval.)]|nr:Mitogen-activated protein kinase [Mycena kentingensis (nom. inval.)]
MAPPPSRRSALEVTADADVAMGRTPVAKRKREREIAALNAYENPTIHGEEQQDLGTLGYPEAQDEDFGTDYGVYSLPRGVLEEARYNAPGEEDEDDDGDDEEIVKRKRKPVRAMTQFCFIDYRSSPAADTQYALVPPDASPEEEGGGWIATVGRCFLQTEDDEDLGQEDADADAGLELMRLDGAVLCAPDYTVNNAAFFVETEYAFYELRAPSAVYKPCWDDFLRPRLIARAAIVAAERRETQVRGYRRDEVEDAVDCIIEALQDPKLIHLQNAPVLQDLIRPYLNQPRVPAQPRFHARPRPKTSPLSDPDLAVLRPENQAQTHVTPLIGRLADGYFTERLRVVGAEPLRDHDATRRQKAEARFFRRCLLRARKRDPRLEYPPEERHENCTRHVKVDGDEYSVNDFVLVKRGNWGKLPPPNIDDDKAIRGKLPEYFWFARVQYFEPGRRLVHLEWLEHGSEILLGEMADPKELFFTNLCDGWPIQNIVGKVQVNLTLRSKPSEQDFFARHVYNYNDASFTSIDADKMNLFFQNKIPHNCLPCHVQALEEQERHGWKLVKDDPDSRQPNGVSYRGNKYHIHEFFLFKSKAEGPAKIGFITDIFDNHHAARDQMTIQFKLVLRIGRLEDIEDDPNNFDPERHVVVTDEVNTIPLTEVIRPVHVYALGFFKTDEERDAWIEYSPYNFYCAYYLPSKAPQERNALWPAKRREVDPTEFLVCEFCPAPMFRDRELEERFDRAEATEERDCCLELFLGTGAFGGAADDGSRGCLKPTHGIEISPSAARTAQKNNPELIVYNQDVNVAFPYFVKSDPSAVFGVDPRQTPKQIYDEKQDIPPPPPREKIKAIFAGLPCQSHSSQNMYKKAEDKKSNLLLTALSFVDYYRPTYFFLENVPGFLQWNLQARQAGKHRVEGGYEQGGLVLLVRALLEMGYQCRFGLLEAGGQGCPQRRRRFFLVAAKIGHTLPRLPQPTHDFDTPTKLGFKVPSRTDSRGIKDVKRPISTARGTAAHAAVTVRDAIGDLLPFDWKYPDLRKRISEDLRTRIMRREHQGIKVLPVDKKRANCGFHKMPGYAYEPFSSFQRQARPKDRTVTDLQHYTRVLIPKNVERTVSIPLEANSDYLSLPDHLGQYQLSNTSSYVGRQGFPGKSLYKRLDWKGHFQTTVTNVHPTAKQGQVLHPGCLRMVTVRELARSQGFPDWYVFVALKDNVVTMHRQIGNAVPWQLGRALGRELRAARLKDFKKRDMMRDDANHG